MKPLETEGCREEKSWKTRLSLTVNKERERERQRDDAGEAGQKDRPLHYVLLQRLCHYSCASSGRGQENLCLSLPQGHKLHICHYSEVD